MNTVLTIAIPTYNHHELLLRQLKQLLSQKTSQTCFELLVFDNYSNPSVESYLNAEGLIVKDFKLVRHSENIGAERNILKCFKECQTDWLWVLSDNDLVHENAVENVLKIIDKAEECIFIHLGQNRSLAGRGLEEFCKEIFYPDSFSISHNLYNIRYLKEYLTYYERWVDTMQGQILFVMKCLDDSGKYFMISDYKPCYDYLPSEWNKLRFIKSTFDLKRIFKKEFSNYPVISKHLFIKIFEMLHWQLLIARSYQRLSPIRFLFLYIGLFRFVQVENWMSLFKRDYRNIIKMTFSRKYYLEMRRATIPADKDFKEII